MSAAQLPPTPPAPTPSAAPTRIAAAALLIASGAVFLGAGLMFTGRSFWDWPASGAYLAWERGFVIAALLASVGGLALLEQLLRAAGAIVLPRLAFVVYLVGAVVLIGAEAAYIELRAFVSAQLVLFVVLACFAQALFGAALLRSRLLPAWIGGAAVIWNAGALLVLALLSPQNMYYPAVHFVVPVLIGLALLVRRGASTRSTSPPAS